jgi:hypothetical protein
MDGYLDEFIDNLSVHTMTSLTVFGATDPNETLEQIDLLAKDIALIYKGNTSVGLMWIITAPMAPAILGFAFTADGGKDISEYTEEIQTGVSTWLWECGTLIAYPLTTDIQLIAILESIGFKETSRTKMYSKDGIVRERLTMEI